MTDFRCANHVITQSRAQVMSCRAGNRTMTGGRVYLAGGGGIGIPRAERLRSTTVSGV